MLQAPLILRPPPREITPEQPEQGPVPMNLGTFGLGCHCPRETRHRLFQVSLFLQEQTEIVVGLGESRPQPQRFSVVSQALSDLPPILQGESQVVVGLDKIGLEPDRFPVVGQRLDHLALSLEGRTEVIVRLGILGVELQRLSEARGGLYQLTSILMDDPLMVSIHGVARVHGYRPREACERGAAFAFPMGNHPQQIQRITMLRLSIEDAPADGFRLLQAPDLVAPNGV